MDNRSTSIVRTALARRILAIACVVTIAGCTTTGDVMQRVPVESFTTAQTAATYMGCISPRIFKDWGDSKVTPNGVGSMIIVSASSFAPPIAIIEVQPSNGEARVTIRRGYAIDRVFDPIITTAKSCS